MFIGSRAEELRIWLCARPTKSKTQSLVTEDLGSLMEGTMKASVLKLSTLAETSDS